jgi:hypothetical protein
MPKVSGFQFNRPQQLAAVLLLLLLAQCLWVFHRQTLTSRDYDFARCGREMWEKPDPLAGYFTTCGNIPDGTLGYRIAGLPLTLQRVVAGQAADTSTWEMRHELGHPASVWQSRRVHRSRPVLFLPGGDPCVYLPQQ